MILKLALEQHRDPRSMHVQAWENCDKLSISFLLDLPHLHSSFTSPQLSETLGVLTGTELVKGSGKRTVDSHGIVVYNATLPGGDFSRRHDTIKSEHQMDRDLSNRRHRSHKEKIAEFSTSPRLSVLGLL